MNDNVSRRAAMKMSAVAVVVALAVAVPTSVWASHQFNDVPTSHPFHAEISAVADAGITTGFPDGGFHPADSITRQAMAAFMERGLGRVATNTSITPISLRLETPEKLTGVFIDAGAHGGGGQGLVHLIGTANFHSSPAQCPCQIQLFVVDLANENVSLSIAFVDLPGDANESGQATASATVQAVVPIAADATRGFALVALLADVSATSVTGRGTLTATYTPFGPDGDDTAAYCSAQEREPNNLTSEAAFLASNPMYGCLEPTGDVDYYLFRLVTGTQLSAMTSGLAGPPTCDTDTRVRIRNSSGAVLADDNDGGPGSCSLATTTATAGSYYVEVLGPTNGVTGSYRLSTSTTGIPE